MKLSVILPCYNEAARLAEALDAFCLQNWSEDWELILADNGSRDGSQEIADAYASKLPQLRLFDASQQRGSAYARNAAVKAAAADALAFCDADDVVDDSWVAAIGEALCKHEFVASRFDVEKLNRPPIQQYGGPIQQEGLQQLWYPPHSWHASGSGLGIRRERHEQVGGFDESLMRLMDTDYCIRVQKLGVPLQFVPEALIYRRNRSTYRRIYDQARLWAHYNTLLYKRHRPPGESVFRPWRRYACDWWFVLRHAHVMVRGNPRARARMIFRLGWQMGLLQGSLKHKIEPAVVSS